MPPLSGKENPLETSIPDVHFRGHSPIMATSSWTESWAHCPSKQNGGFAREKEAETGSREHPSGVCQPSLTGKRRPNTALGEPQLTPNPFYKEFTNLGWGDTKRVDYNTLQGEMGTIRGTQALGYSGPKEQLILTGTVEESSLISEAVIVERFLCVRHFDTSC